MATDRGPARRDSYFGYDQVKAAAAVQAALARGSINILSLSENAEGLTPLATPPLTEAQILGITSCKWLQNKPAPVALAGVDSR